MPDQTIPPSLERLPATDAETGEVTTVIETPKGSRNKYNYDEGYRAFRLGGVMPEGMSFPYDFGFIPSTLGEDGDPLDVLVLMDSPVMVGCVLQVRLLGVIEAEQTEKDGETVRNDRLIAAATHAHTHEHIRSLDDLPPYLVGEIEGFFAQYNRLKGKEFKPLGRGGPDRAQALLQQGASAWKKGEHGA